MHECNAVQILKKKKHTHTQKTQKTQKTKNQRTMVTKDKQ